MSDHWRSRLEIGRWAVYDDKCDEARDGHSCDGNPTGWKGQMYGAWYVWEFMCFVTKVI